MFTEEEKVTIESYNQTATQWVATHMNPNQCRAEFEIFKKYLPAGKILEIGVGGGRDAKRFAEAGYGYTGVDVSSGLLEEAQKNNPSLTFLIQDVYQLQFPFLFDGFWCAATLLHIPKRRIHEALQSIHQVVKPHGIGFICVKQGNGDMVLDEDEYGKRYFSYYTQNEFSEILARNGFSILETSVLPVSPKTTWLNFFVKKEK